MAAKATGLRAALAFLVLAKAAANHEYLYNGTVTCSREKSQWLWYFDRWEYFFCDHDEFCCGDAWNRRCCDSSEMVGMDPDYEIAVWALAMVIVVLVGVIAAAWCNYKRRTKVYLEFQNWWEVARPRPAKRRHRKALLEDGGDRQYHHFSQAAGAGATGGGPQYAPATATPLPTPVPVVPHVAGYREPPRSPAEQPPPPYYIAV